MKKYNIYIYKICLNSAISDTETRNCQVSATWMNLSVDLLYNFNTRQYQSHFNVMKVETSNMSTTKRAKFTEWTPNLNLIHFKVQRCPWITV